MNTKQLTYPTIEEQQQYWIMSLTKREMESSWFLDNPSPETPDDYDPATADPKPEELSRTESLTDWYDHGRNDEDRGDLRDEGRNPDGSGESYAERNV